MCTYKVILNQLQERKISNSKLFIVKLGNLMRSIPYAELNNYGSKQGKHLDKAVLR